MKIDNNKLLIRTRSYFNEYLPKQKKSSANTITAYRITLNQFIDYMAEKNACHIIKLDLDSFSRQNVSAFLDDLEANHGCSVKTRNAKLNHLRSFLKYVSLLDPCDSVYYAELASIPLKKHVKKLTVDHMSQQEIKALLASPDTSTLRGMRDQFIMILMYDTGARVQEIVDTNVNSLRLDEPATATLHGKGNKSRTVPLMKSTVRHARKYLQIFHPEESEYSSVPLFYVKRRDSLQRISDDAIRVFVQKYGDMARVKVSTIPEKVHPHMLRHSRAMHLYQNGMDLTLISQWLGHSDLKVTQIYAYADTEMKRKAIEKATGSYEVADVSVPSKYDVNDDEVIKKLYGLA